MAELRRSAATVCLAALLAGCQHGDTRASEQQQLAWALTANATVVTVIDGDTIDVAIDNSDDEPTRVRLIGIDTPELAREARPAECFGAEAAAHTAALLPAGTPVQLQRDVEARDDYGRLLAYVFRAADGLFVNAQLIRDGHAVPLRIQPNTTHSATFAAVAGEAEVAGRGLWASCSAGDGAR